MSLSEKYGIPKDKITALVKDGWISCTVPAYEEIYKRYRQLKNSSESKHSICSQIAAERGCSVRHVEFVVDKFE